MSSLLYGLLTIAAMLVSVPAAVLVIQLLLSLVRPKLPSTQSSSSTRIAVLVPAHDEASGIAHTIQSIKKQLPDGSRLVVVADNCSDHTAALARQAGAEVIERFDAVLRGKGYALDFGLRWLSTDPPDVLIVLDADCEIHADGIPRLAERCLASGRPIQSLYLMRSPGPSSLRMRIAEFAWLVKNHLRPLGSSRIGAPCQLTGTGMAFPWRLIASVSLANGHLVEDMKLGVDLAMQGTPPQFAPDVLVTSSFPTTAQGVASQRQRWEHGHLAMLGRELPRLIGTALMRRSPIAFALAADLLVPPLALLVLLLVFVLALGLGGWFAAGWVAPLAIAGTSLVLLCVATLLAWFKHGRSVLTLSDLLSVPSYVLWKIPLYLRFIFNRQIDWIRTQRDGE